MDKIDSKVAALFNSAFIFAAVAVTFIYLIVFDYFWLAYLMTFLWGV